MKERFKKHLDNNQRCFPSTRNGSERTRKKEEDDEKAAARSLSPLSPLVVMRSQLRWVDSVRLASSCWFPTPTRTQ